MARLVTALMNQRKVVFDRGSFDNWCVYVVEADGSKRAPLDTTYFADLKTIAKAYVKDKVYQDFLVIYDKTTKEIDLSVLHLINDLVDTYHDGHKVLIEQWFTVIYAGMIAEENKRRAILKKRIKHLGIYQTLILDFDPKIAATFSKGKKWQELDLIMRELGI